MDGNGRWAELHGVSVAEGHRAGTRALRRTVEAAIELGIGTLVVYAFSTENWARPADEVADLLVLLSETIDGELPDLAKQGVRTRFLGRRDRVDDATQVKMRELEAETAHLETLQLWIAFDYGGRAELVEAAQRLVADGVDAEAVDEQAIASRLYAPELADLDSARAHLGRGPPLQLHALGGGVRRARLRGDALARLRGGRAACRGRGVRRAAASLRSASRHVSPFWSRIAVTAVLLPVVLGLVWVGGWWLFGLAVVGGLLALHELYGMARALRPIVIGGYAGLVLTLLGAQLGGPEWLLLGILATLPAALLSFFVSSARQSAVAGFSITLLGVAWVGGGLALLLLLRDLPVDGRLLLFTTMLTVFADDTAAFFVGRAIGRHRLAPAISPGKSWEGFVAGTLAAVVVPFFALYEQDVLTTGESLVLGLVIGLAATLGDLFESAVKRDLGVKDSGSLLAGHGGVLDRLDSLLWAGPAAYVALLALT